MCVSVCRIYLLLCSIYVMLVLNHQSILSQKLRPSKLPDSVVQMESSLSVFKSHEEPTQVRTSRKTRSTLTEIPRNLKTSCQHKCGQQFDVPCSCDIQCLVYKNCCEDLNLACPEMLMEAESLYNPELLNSQIECIHNGILAISGCPNVSSVGTANLSNTWINEHRERMNRLKATLAGKESLTNTEEDSQGGARSEEQGQSILQLLNDIPISDITTGLLYKSPKIFSCNAGPKSVPAPWSVEIHLHEMLIGIKQLQHLKAEKDGIEYIPPAQLRDDSAYRLCVPHAISTCKHPQDKCEVFRSYVLIPGPSGTTVYINKYCALCNGLKEENIHSLLKYDGVRTQFALSVIMSLTNDQLKLSALGQGNLERLIPWMEAECDLSNERQVVESGKTSTCHIDSCTNMNVLRPDGTCKSLRKFTVALSDHGHIPFSVSDVISRNGQEKGQEEVGQKMVVDGPVGALPDLIRCTLETHFGQELGETTYPLMILRDHRLNTTVFVVDVQLYMPLGKESEQIDKITSALSLIAKSLFLYKTWYLAQTTELAKSSNPYNEKLLEEIETLEEGSTYRDILSFQAQKCSEKLDNFTICVCDTSITGFFGKFEDNQRCSIVCFADSLCKNQVKEVQAFSESKCFSQIRSLDSHGTCWTPVSFTLVVLLMVLVITH